MSCPASQASALPLHQIARAVHLRTDGNPLFMINLLGDWEQNGMATSPEAIANLVPSGLSELIARQLERLPPEDARILEAASLAGAHFETMLVAAALQAPLELVDDSCERLAQRGQFIAPAGTTRLPSGSANARFAFRHALYQDALGGHLPASRLIRLHRRIATALEDAFGSDVGARAVELAMHLEQAQEPVRAIPYLRQGALHALGRHAYHEAVTLLNRALDLLDALPAAVERAFDELALRLLLGPALLANKGYASIDAEHCYARALELAEQVADPQQLFVVLTGARMFQFTRGNLPEALALADRMHGLSIDLGAPALQAEAHFARGGPLGLMGRLDESVAEIERGFGLTEPVDDPAIALASGQDSRVSIQGILIWVLALRGDTARRLEVEAQMLARAEALAHPLTIVYALGFSVISRVTAYDTTDSVIEHAAALIANSREHGFPTWEAFGEIAQAWVQVMRYGAGVEACAQMRKAMELFLSTGNEAGQSLLRCMLCEAYWKTGDRVAARAAMAEGIEGAQRTSQTFYLAEMHRLCGEMAWSPPEIGPADATPREQFEAAIAVARAQGAQELERRASRSLAACARTPGDRDTVAREVHMDG